MAVQFWILDDDHNVVPAGDVDDFVDAIIENYEGFEDRFRVARTQIDGDCWVSTVFLFAYPWSSGLGPPRLFETMVFGGEFDKMQARFATWDEALAGHAQAVAFLLDDSRHF